MTVTELKVAEDKEEKILFMDTSGIGVNEKTFVELCKDQMLARTSMSVSLVCGGMWEAWVV